MRVVFDASSSIQNVEFLNERRCASLQRCHRLRNVGETRFDAKRMSAGELDAAAAQIEELEEHAQELRQELKEQVEAFGSTPPRAEKSKRLLGDLYQFTLSASITTEVKDEVLKIATVCKPSLFSRLFKPVTRYKLIDGASMLLAGTLPEDAPRNLRQMFAKAVVTKESAPRLRIEKLDEDGADGG